MAGKTAVFENDLLKLIFHNLGISLIGDATGIPAAATAGTLYLSLHTSDPTDLAVVGQQSGETTYPDYARIGLVRGVSTCYITGNSVSPAAAVDFPTANVSMGATTQTAGWVGIGTSATGQGKLLYTGVLTPNIIITSGVTPRLTTASAVTES